MNTPDPNAKLSKMGAGPREEADDHVFAGGGELEPLMRSIDWAKTPIGPVSGWSQALRTMVGLVLRNRFPILVWWGPRYVQFYNTAFQAILGVKHPGAMGQPGPECWAEIWDVVGPLAERPLMGGEATWNDDLMVLMNRKGFPEETHFNLAYSPIPDETVAGTGIGGVIATVAETTEQIYGARQMRLLRELGARLVDAKSPETVCTEAARTLLENPADVPFARLYMIGEHGTTASLAAHGGFQGADDVRLPPTVDLHQPDDEGWRFQAVMTTRRPQVVTDLGRRFPAMPAGPWATPPHTAIVLPLGSPDRPWLYGILVLGLNPHRALDDGYQSFCELAAAQVVTALRNVYAAQEELKRTEALVLLDRAKTAFFSNVSHEFRTPLTLMLGPLEELIAHPDRPPEARATALDLTYRNALRLLKLVNALLDFARVEAKRVAKRFRPTDLGERVRDLTGAFRFAIEKAGLRLLVECEASPAPVYVDPELFEKILLNLLSNALKFTFTGDIAVTLRYVDSQAQIIVRDTGIGIPETELPKIFERFHRVEGSPGRSIEGSGIGLALVKELVHLHGGTISVESRLGAGTAFRVSIPLGTGHLQSEDIAERLPREGASSQATAHVEEALQWLSVDAAEAGTLTDLKNQAARSSMAPVEKSPDPTVVRSLVMVVDDNADMRRYLHQMLSPHYRIAQFADGRQALDAALARTPDLVLTDVMMPVMDGFALLAALRADDRTRSVPVIMLSARAGADAGAEGLQAGADDYVVKPFTANELCARIESNLRLTRMRKELACAEERARNEIAHAHMLAVRNDELERLNAELDQFAYVSSHDLREPLRMVTQYMGILDRKLGPALSDENREFLNFAVDGARRMQELITDLLAFTQAGSREDLYKPVDLAAVVQDVQRLLADRIASTKTAISVGPLPLVVGSTTKLSLVMQNLIGNALKFQTPGQGPEIAISSERTSDAWEISVRDNGIGIDPKYHRKIFEVFQRLHRREEYAGTGMGLAISRKIVEQHQGELRVESRPGAGSRFIIRLPLGPIHPAGSKAISGSEGSVS